MRADALIAGLGIALYTLTLSGADGITKFIAQGYAAPQLFFVSALIILGLTALTARVQNRGGVLRTAFPRAMALRAILTVVASVAFFMAFRHLPFADVFLFMGLIPILAALMSGPVLGERISPAAWLALSAGLLGVWCLLPSGLSSLTQGHLWALLASGTGASSLLLARYIGRAEKNLMPQVFYPYLAIAVTMGLALPFVWQPMGAADLSLIVAYAVLLFAARWMVVAALRILPAYVATPLMNLQFVWMVAIGFFAFGEVPGSGTILGAALVIGSGLWLVLSEARLPTGKPAAA